MRDIAKGFRVGDVQLPWRTELEAAAVALGQPASAAAARGLIVPCSMACGLPAVAAHLSGPAADRPVLGVAYDLAEFGGVRAEDWLGAVADSLGPAEAVKRDKVAGRQRAEDAVVLDARWSLGDFAIGLAVFGGPRQVAHGLSVGTLYLSWREECAAEPYLAEWRERSARIRRTAAALTDIGIYALAWPGHPLHGANDMQTEGARERRHLRLCLKTPELLATPDEIAERLTATSFAVWFSQAENVWGASTPWETFAVPVGTAVPVERIELKPARGGGYSALEIGRWRVMTAAGSGEIGAAATRLEAFRGVSVRRHDSYDY